MLTLIAVGFAAGVITGLSPCILPVLPAVLATSVMGGPEQPRRPYLVIAGLVTSFGVFTLAGGALLSALGLPQDALLTASLILMAAVGLGLLIPAVGHLLERPFARVPQDGIKRDGSAFAFGATFGLAFVPCAGPVLAAITVLAATSSVNSGLLVLTVAYCAGVAVPLLVFALAGQRMTGRITSVRNHLPAIRRATGAILIVTAAVLWLGAADALQRLVPSYVQAAQDSIENSDAARDALAGLAPQEPQEMPAAGAAASAALSFDECEHDPSKLQNCGPAPELVGITAWLNSPPTTLEQLRGKVVLVDFWTYSCINCQRTLPYLAAWDESYRDQGLVIVGVHAPEFAFEHVVSNVEENADRLGVRYPIAIDNDFATWQAYHQRYWPAHYLIDREGVVRQVHYGEGAYDDTEALIQQLLGVPVQTDNPTPQQNQAATPETYLGFARASGYVQDVVPGESTYSGSEPPNNQVSLNGEWTVTDEDITAGRDASLAINYRAAKVFLVLGGDGTVTVDGTAAIQVHGAPALYTLHEGTAATQAILHLDFTPGVAAYAFTFG